MPVEFWMPAPAYTRPSSSDEPPLWIATREFGPVMTGLLPESRKTPDSTWLPLASVTELTPLIVMNTSSARSKIRPVPASVKLVPAAR